MSDGVRDTYAGRRDHQPDAPMASEAMPERVFVVHTGVHRDSDKVRYWADEKCLWRDGTEYVRADLATPRPWSTAEELQPLPIGSVVLDGYDPKMPWQKKDNGRWATAGDVFSFQDLGSYGPGLILYVPPQGDRNV